MSIKGFTALNDTVILKDKLERIWGRNLCVIMEFYPVICLEGTSKTT